ncbi:MAG: DinB family protein [Pseudomonadota bacterium]
MITREHARLMAQYNQWMNDKLYVLCGSLTDAQRKEDRGAFFGSLHRTLNHILYGDLAFMSRFTANPSVVPELGVDLFDDFAELEGARRELDQRILSWAEALSPEWLTEELTYTSKVDGVTRSVPRWVLVVHMFNHETHHRGQLTTVLTQLGLDIGTTDIPFMARFQV